MSSYSAVAIYNLDAEFVAWAIMGPQKLQSTNVYREGEEEQLQEQLARLNQDVDLRQHWPHPQDPEVQVLLADETFAPISYIETDVVDEDASQYVYKKIAGQDESGNPTWVDSEELDPELSLIVYKKAMVPERPTDVMWRIKKASEQIARQRAGIAIES